MKKIIDSKDVNVSVRKVLESIFSYEVAKEFSCSGKSKIGGGEYIIKSFFCKYSYSECTA